MKSIRHSSQLDQVLDRALAWRKKELTGLRFVVDKAGNGEHLILCRAGVAILYAHWEGFAKEAANGYLRLVAGQNLRLSRLTTNFVAIALASSIRVSGQSRKTIVHEGLVKRIAHDLDCITFSRWQGVIQTRSNLQWLVFREILEALSLDPSEYSPAMMKAVDRLVGLRNAIAHGQYLAIAADEYDELHQSMMAVVQCFRDQVGDAAAAKSYLRT